MADLIRILEPHVSIMIPFSNTSMELDEPNYSTYISIKVLKCKYAYNAYINTNWAADVKITIGFARLL